MTRAWTGTVLVGLCVMWPLACEVSVNDGDPIIPVEAGGTAGTAGSGGSSGLGGSSGSAGSAGQGGSAGDTSLAGDGGSAGSGEVLTPTCAAEAGDDQDPCLVCIKQNCCTEWQACNDDNCQTERLDVIDCASNADVVDSETYGDCISASSAAADGFLQINTEALMECVNEVPPAEGDAGGIPSAHCQEACFGHEIFFE